jgi:hypothetical protein
MSHKEVLYRFDYGPKREIILDIVSSNIEACEQLIKYTANKDDKEALEKEIAELKMALGLTPSSIDDYMTMIHQ